MKVMACPSCGARYNTERLATNARFKCRRCGEIVHASYSAPEQEGERLPSKPFSLLLLLGGLLTLGGLLLWANPAFGVEHHAWPWDVVSAAGGPSCTLLVLLAAAGVLGVLTAFGIAPGGRSVVTAALVACAAMLAASGMVGSLGLAVPLAPFVAMTALAGGLWLDTRESRSRFGATLVFGGGAALVWWLAFQFDGQGSHLRGMVENIRQAFGGQLQGGSETLWKVVVHEWVLLLAGVLGVAAGLGPKNRPLVWITTLLLLAYLLLPSAVDLVVNLGERVKSQDVGSLAALFGRDALLTGGVALWWLGAASLADLTRHRRRAS